MDDSLAKRRRIIADDEDDDGDHSSQDSNPDDVVNDKSDGGESEGEGEDLEETWLAYVISLLMILMIRHFI